MTDERTVRRYRIKPVIIPIGPSIAYVPLTKGAFALIDREDAVLAGRFNWSAQRNRNSGELYAYTNYPCPERGSLFLHRLLLGLKKGDKRQGDHIRPHNTLDNRRCNIRIATFRQNMANKGIPRNNKTGFKGVGLCKATGMYRADIKSPSGKVNLGCTFSTAFSAAEAYDAKALELYGEYARTNRMIREGL